MGNKFTLLIYLQSFFLLSLNTTDNHGLYVAAGQEQLSCCTSLLHHQPAEEEWQETSTDRVNSRGG